MSIATAKEKSASERFMLVRMEPARMFTFADFTDDGDDNYSMSFPHPVSRMKYDALELTPVVGDPATVLEFTYDYDAQRVRFKYAGVFNPDTPVLLHYYLFYTGVKNRHLPVDPSSAESESNPLVDWQARLTSYPPIRQSIKNITSGVFSLENIHLTLANTDDTFQEHLGSNTTFYNKSVIVWQGIDSADSLQKVYKGSVSRILADQGAVSIDVLDAFSGLKKKATFGDKNYLYWNKNTFPELDPAHEGKPIPLFLGPWSRFGVKKGDFTIYGGPDNVIDPEKTTEAVCIDFNASVGTSNCRDWFFGRTIAGSEGVGINRFFYDPAVGTYVGTPDGPNSIDSDTTYASYTLTGTEFEFGDVFRVRSGGVDYYARVIDRAGDTITVRYDIGTPSTPFLSSPTFFSAATPSVIIVDNDGVVTRPLSNDYVLAFDATDGGNYLVGVSFFPNFEADYDTITTLHPSTHKVYCVFRPHPSSTSHAWVLRRICEDAGLAVNAASFEAADVELDADVLFSVPFFDQGDHGTYLEYAEKILEATLGYLVLNENLEVEYKLLSGPVAGTEVDKATILRDSLSVDIDYGDLYTQVIAYNPHNPDKTTAKVYGNSSLTYTNETAEYLHGIENPTRFVHVLYDISARIDAIGAIKTNRSAIYKFDTATQHIDAEIGDDVTITTDAVPSGSANLKIISLDKSPTKTVVEAAEFDDL